MHHDRSAILEKAFYLIQGRRGQRLKESQTEGLRCRGVDSIEDDVCARALYPGGPALRMKTMARFCKLEACLPFARSMPTARLEPSAVTVTLRDAFGKAMLNFGFAFNEGSFRAVETGKGLREFTVAPAPEG